MRSARRSALLICCSVVGHGAPAANPAEVMELPQIDVVGTTNLPGSDIALSKLPANAQIYTSRDLRDQHAGNLTEFLEQNATGVTVNAAQGNPYQPDLNVRGFTASPLLGTPQGVSVFFDGVRINEPFGDAVNWDLIPASALSSIQLIPGSNPAFGLNTLGGAIALYTKSGASAYPERPGGSIDVSGGSFGRRTLSFEAGGKRAAWDWFVTANAANDAGWAEHNPSRVRQWFGKVGWQDERSDLDLSYAGADNRLEGSQTLPVSFPDIRAAYTYPDRNLNRADLLALKGSRALSEALLLSGNVYLRRMTNHTLSSNVNADAVGADPAEATNDRAVIAQTAAGAGLQLTHRGTIAGRAHKVSIGASLDRARARYTRETQDAVFTADRGTVGTSEFVGETDADSSTRYLGAFVSDSIDLDPRWTLTLAGRYNRADVSVADRTGVAPALNGAHTYHRFNPAVGLNFNPAAGATLYASYNEGMRAPTAIELTCADPDAPCKLPNSFLADPELRPVTSTTFEFGARGRLDRDTTWSAALFRTDLHDDLQFVSSNGLAINAGHFQNVGRTRRQGLELAAGTRLGRLAVALHYSYIDARFRDGFVENSPSNSTADANGAINVRRGDRMPSIPRQALKLRAELNPTPSWHLAMNLRATSSVYARGDENNQDANGRVPGYAVVNLDTRCDIGARWQLYARMDNVFDRRYANFGILGDNAFTGPGQQFDPAGARAEQFRGYGAPHGAWIGAQFALE
jgi:iron complex outermembrane receptor protein